MQARKICERRSPLWAGRLLLVEFGGDLAPQVRGLSVWETVMNRVQPVPHDYTEELGDPTTDGLTVFFAP